jgi:hypothetical protein
MLTLIRNLFQTTFLPELERQRLSREFAGWLARAGEEGAGVLS